ncbi:MAG: hypothetical protein KDE59_19385 [Anaerolineales bacterium]|nr:hypothetical protein [Anaerolineales bacterium]
MNWLRRLLYILGGLSLACGLNLPGQGGGTGGFTDGEAETFAALPLYGELRFQILAGGSAFPISGAVLEVTNLAIEEQETAAANISADDGVLVVHQLQRGTVYYGAGPDEPIFTFSAPGYSSIVFTATELAEEAGLPLYSDAGLPRVTTASGQELPLYEFTIYLSPEESSVAPVESNDLAGALALIQAATTADQEANALQNIWE